MHLTIILLYIIDTLKYTSLKNFKQKISVSYKFHYQIRFRGAYVLDVYFHYVITDIFCSPTCCSVHLQQLQFFFFFHLRTARRHVLYYTSRLHFNLVAVVVAAMCTHLIIVLFFFKLTTAHDLHMRYRLLLGKKFYLCKFFSN